MATGRENSLAFELTTAFTHGNDLRDKVGPNSFPLLCCEGLPSKTDQVLEDLKGEVAGLRELRL